MRRGKKFAQPARGNFHFVWCGVWKCLEGKPGCPVTNIHGAARPKERRGAATLSRAELSSLFSSSPGVNHPKAGQACSVSQGRQGAAPTPLPCRSRPGLATKASSDAVPVAVITTPSSPCCPCRALRPRAPAPPAPPRPTRHAQPLNCRSSPLRGCGFA